MCIFALIHSNLLPSNRINISAGAKGSIRLLQYNSPVTDYINMHYGYSLFLNYNNYKMTYFYLSATHYPFLASPKEELISHQLLFGKSIFNTSYNNKLFNIPVEGRVVGSIGLSQNISYYNGEIIANNWLVTEHESKKQSYFSIPIQIEIEKTFWSRFGLSMTLFACIGKDNMVRGLSYDIFIKNK